MKFFFSRYSHWIALFVIGFSFSAFFFQIKHTRFDIAAMIFGGIGFLSFAYLTLLTEKQIRKQKKN